MRSNNIQTMDNQKLLLQAFQKQESLSIADIETLLHCNRMSAHNYLNRLMESGCQFDKKIVNRKAIYSLQCNSDNTPYEPLTLDTLRKITLLQELEQGPIPREEFRSHFTIDSTDDISESDQAQLDVGLTKYYELINSLQKEGLLVLNPENDTYSLGGQNPTLGIYLTLDSLMALNDELYYISGSSPYYQQFQSIHEKTDELLGNFKTEDDNRNNYLLYGKKTDGIANVPQGLRKILKTDYANHLLTILYTDRTQETSELTIAIGLIVYSLEKDTFYLLCRNTAPSKSSITDAPSQEYIILNANRIQEIRVEPKQHKDYKSEFFRKLYEDMFSISLAPAEKVVVEFDNFGNIHKKLKHLTTQRKNAEIKYQKETNTLLYEDMISGLEDFAAYLRSFGSSVKVIAPESLKKMMKLTAARALNRYEEELGHELS